MLNKSERAKFRSTIFRHLDGIATSTSAYALHEKGVLEHLLSEKRSTLERLTNKFKANEGYLNVALRILCSQGWLVQHIDNKTDIIEYEINEKSKEAFELVPLYKDVVNLLTYSVKFPEEGVGADAFIALEKIFKKFDSNYGLSDLNENGIQYQILKHMEGVVAAPIIVMLGVNGLFHKYFMEASFRAQEYHKNPESFKKILDFLTKLDWFKSKNSTYQFTEKGLFFAKR
ncbi:MAG: class I SAM-dependent methyltransferase, partial [Flavobacteriaceae bacterium]